jgi:hypothetical protein
MTLLTFLWLARGIVQLHNACPILGCACTLVTCKQCNAYAHCSFVTDVCSHMLVIFSSCSSCSSQNRWYFVRWHHKLSHSAFVVTNQSSQNYWVMIPTKIFMEYVMGMIWDTPLGFPVFRHRLIGNLLWLRNLSIMLFNLNSVLVTLQHCVSVWTRITWCVSVSSYRHHAFKHIGDVVMVLVSLMIYWPYQNL